MPVRIVKLGAPRHKGEGLRIGTVRRPPRGVPKTEYASRDFYDVWLPNLAPSQDLVKQALAARDEKAGSAFERKYRSERSDPPAQRVIEFLAALSHTAAFSVGCYCEDENRCHRSILRQLLADRKAQFGR